MTTLLGKRKVCLAITEHVPGLENSQGTGWKVPSENRVDVPLKRGHCWRGEAVTRDRRLQRSSSGAFVSRLMSGLRHQTFCGERCL